MMMKKNLKLNFGFDHSDDEDRTFNQKQTSKAQIMPKGKGGDLEIEMEENKKQCYTSKYKEIRLDEQFERLIETGSAHTSKKNKMESKLSSRSSLSKKSKHQQFENDGSSLGMAKKSKSSTASPYVLIEGPEPSQDLSYKWVQRNIKVQLIEQGIAVDNFESQYKLRDLDTEFRLLRKLTETKDHLQNQEVFEKASSKLNRYSDLKPFKHTRVRLAQRNADIYDSYINANYINTCTAQNDQLFIATQGPLPQTQENFWRMILQENIQLIVMLTSCKEGGKVKCDQYWPSEIEDSITFDNTYQLTLISVESVMPNLIKRKFRIQNDDQDDEQIVVQLQYTAWPDHGAPDECDSKIIAKILEYMKEYHQRSRSNNGDNKIVIHCSAGIGRSGTIIAIYNIQQAVDSLLKNQDQLMQTGHFSQLSFEEKELIEPRISVFGVVRRLREQRYCMVQVQTQYEFIYEYLNQWLKEKKLYRISPKMQQ